MPGRGAPRRRHLGSWSIFCDIAGQVSHAPDNRIVTVAAVGITLERVSSVRRALRAGFRGKPEKWKRGGLRGFEVIEEIAIKYRLPIAVRNYYIADPVLWDRFFQDARAFRREAETKLGKPLTYAEGDTTLRMHFLVREMAKLIRQLLGPAVFQENSPRGIVLDVVADNDLRGGGSASISRRHRRLGESNAPDIGAECRASDICPLRDRAR